MFVALVAVRAGRVFAMGEPTSRARRNGRYICFGIAVLAMVAGVPWPGLANGTAAVQVLVRPDHLTLRAVQERYGENASGCPGGATANDPSSVVADARA